MSILITIRVPILERFCEYELMDGRAHWLGDLKGVRDHLIVGEVVI
jgi:hypothetical protein